MISKLKNLLLENHDTKQMVVKNIFWLGFGQLASRFIRAFIIIYAARLLGPSEYGVFSYALSLAGFFTIFADIGVNSIFTREAARKPEETNQYFATSFWMKIFLLCVTTVLIVFVAPYFSKIEAVKILLPLVAVIVIFDNIREFANAFFRAKEKMEIEAFLTIITNISITFFGFIILSHFQTSKALTITYALSTGTGSLIGIYLLRKWFAGIIGNFRARLAVSISKIMLPIGLMSLVGAFMLNIDIIMLGWWQTSADVGYYSAGQKIVQVLYTIAAIIASATFPALSKFIGAGNQALARALLERGVTVSLLFATPIAAGGLVLGKPIIELLYGKTYLPSVIPFQILIASIVFVFIQYNLANAIFAHNKQNLFVPYVFIVTITNIILNILLIPAYGMIGAAIGTLFTQAINFLFYLKLTKRIIDFHALRYLQKIIIASVCMGFISFILNAIGTFVIVNIVVSAILYGAILIALKEKNAMEMMYMLKKTHQKPPCAA